MNLISEIKEIVIYTGLNSKIEDIQRLEYLMKNQPFYYWGDKPMTSQLNDSEIIYYFKGLVIIEKGTGSFGSTTPAARVYRDRK